ncbi:MAG TPA: autotransporter-associated beta strand repeat-containing protein [Candidatus Acidoferrales bacterium]|jgi:autotransporter-associated beta strand protein|nr:autotransporter-associated beta strand repeat-containing protein [Candidatus Acidoferrales bacterium]
MRPTLSLHTPARIFTSLCCVLATALSVSAANLNWTASVNGNWDSTTPNWFNGSTPTAYNNGDNVSFSDTTFTYNVTIVSTVLPGSVLVNASGNYSFSGSGIAGGSGLTKNGTGMLTLSTSNTYSGPTIINGGTLALVVDGSISGSHTIVVASGTTLDASGRSDGTLGLVSGQTLAGAGSISGLVTVAPGAAIAPGNSTNFGTLTFDNNLTLAGNVIMKLNKTTAQNDLLTGVDILSYSGTLVVTNLGSSLALGDSFTLFSSSSSSGNFTNILGSPGPGLVYYFNPGTGVLSVSNTPVAYTRNVWLNTLNGSIITVHFDDLVQPSSASNTDNYTVYTKSLSAGAVNVTNAVVQDDQQTVALYLDAPAGEFFAVGISNVLDLASNTLNTAATGYTTYTTNTDIGTVGDPAFAGETIPIFNDTFTVTANGSDIGDTNDHCHLVYQPVVGNFEMAAQVTRLDASAPAAKAGLMTREDTSPGSRSLGVYFTPLTSSGLTPSNQIVTVYRSGTNASANAFTTPIDSPSFGWLRMTRTNSVFTVYYGSNGVSWTPCGSVTQALNGTMLAGLATTSNTNGLNTKAGYNSFGVTGARPGDGVVPSLKVSVFQKTNLVVSWTRTPHDFAVQIATNLVQATNSSTGSNSVPQWGFVMFPVFDTSLTGTNSAMPTQGRYMTVPMNLFPNTPMYLRLAQVDRVIPDPIVATAGYVLSVASSNLVKTTSAGTLCNDSVDTASVLTQNSTSVVCPAGHVYQFTTANSGSGLHTALQTRNLKSLQITCDGNFSAGNYKAQVTFTNAVSSTATNITFVAAATATPQPATTTCPVVVTINILQ